MFLHMRLQAIQPHLRRHRHHRHHRRRLRLKWRSRTSEFWDVRKYWKFNHQICLAPKGDRIIFFNWVVQPPPTVDGNQKSGINSAVEGKVVEIYHDLRRFFFALSKRWVVGPWDFLNQQHTMNMEIWLVFSQQSWKWKNGSLGDKPLIFQGSIFHVYDMGHLSRRERSPPKR